MKKDKKQMKNNEMSSNIIPERGLEPALRKFTVMEQQFIRKVVEILVAKPQFPIDQITDIHLKTPIGDSKAKYFSRNEVTFFINPIIYTKGDGAQYRPETHVTTVWQDPTVVYSDNGNTMEFKVGHNKPLEDYTLKIFGGFWDPLERPVQNKDSLVVPVLQKAFQQNTHAEIEFLTSLGLEEAFNCFGFTIILLPNQYVVGIYRLSAKTCANLNDNNLIYDYNLDYTLLIDKETSIITSVDSIDPTLLPTTDDSELWNVD